MGSDQYPGLPVQSLSCRLGDSSTGSSAVICVGPTCLVDPDMSAFSLSPIGGPAIYPTRCSDRYICHNRTSVHFSWRQLHVDMVNPAIRIAFVVVKSYRRIRGITASGDIGPIRIARGCSNSDGWSYRAKTTERDRKSARVDSSTAPKPGNAMDSFAASPIGPDDSLFTCDRTDFRLGAEV